jgi:hypothetical protein
METVGSKIKVSMNPMLPAIFFFKRRKIMSLIVVDELDFLESNPNLNQLKGGFLLPNQPAFISSPPPRGKGNFAFSEVSSSQNGTETQLSSYSIAGASTTSEDDSLTRSSASSSSSLVLFDSL